MPVTKLDRTLFLIYEFINDLYDLRFALNALKKTNFDTYTAYRSQATFPTRDRLLAGVFTAYLYTRSLL